MKINFLLLLGACCMTTPMAAQTVYLPSNKSAAERGSRDKASKEAAAESRIVNKMNAVNDVSGMGYDIVAFDNRSVDVRGTPFLLPSWSQGDVMLGTATKAVPVILKFDVYSQQVRVWRPAQKDSIIIAPEKLQEFTLRPTGADGQILERHFRRLPEVLAPGLSAAYAEDLSEGNELRLLVFYKKTILKGQKPTAGGYGSSAPADVFQNSSQYFIRWSDGTYIAVKPNRSNILTAIAQRQSPIVTAEIASKSKARTDAELGEMVARLDKAISSSGIK
jgi:hypothetical protein